MTPYRTQIPHPPHPFERCINAQCPHESAQAARIWAIRRRAVRVFFATLVAAYAFAFALDVGALAWATHVAGLLCITLGVTALASVAAYASAGERQ